MKQRNVYSVGQINTYIRNMFAQDFMMNHVAVRGEVSDCKYHSSGHIYFTLKDETGVLKAIMFRTQAARGLPFRMKEGDRVVVIGAIRIYERDGKYQLYARSITKEGAGKLYEEYEKLKKRLLAEGLFDDTRKRKIPSYAKKIGVVTAGTGAVIQDICNVSKRRNPYVQIILYPAKVQGTGAADTINKWVDEGHEIYIITGRPFNSYEPSRKWLDEHNLKRVPLYCVDKYGREIFEHEYEYNMTLEQLYSMTFDFAIEDSPSAFEHVLHFHNCKVAVFDRPWNRQAEFPNDNFVRCKNWNQIDKVFEEYAGNAG